MENNFHVDTPHAAVVIWNYKDRLGADGSNISTVDDTEKEIIINTSDCISIETTKAKGNPQGSFRFVLAPSTNWVSAITAGSWCCIFMSTKEIKPWDLTTANDTREFKKNSLKMIGKIESVRIETQVDQSGARRSLYYVSGVDWGCVFNTNIYIDPAIPASGDPSTQGNILFVALRKLFEDKNNHMQYISTDDVITGLKDICGVNLTDINKGAQSVGKLGKSVYEFKFPQGLKNYLGLSSDKIMSNINLKSGSLQKLQNKYEPVVEAVSVPSVLTLQGQFSLWQVMMENSNPSLNEMFCEIDWDDEMSDAPNFILYKRIKPFSFKEGKKSNTISSNIRSYFQLVKRHEIHNINVVSINAGTNSRDKFNYAQIRFDTQQLQALDNIIRRGLETFDEVAFQREGFKAFIESTKQLPIVPKKDKNITHKEIGVTKEVAAGWVGLLREWYFDTHRMLNGTINMVGVSEYMAVGNNIQFDLSLINPTLNMTETTLKGKNKYYVLAHIESISHKFSIEGDGARSYMTNIQFSRGVIIEGGKENKKGHDDKNKSEQKTFILDQDATLIPRVYDINSINTVLTQHEKDPGPPQTTIEKDLKGQL